MSEVNKEMEELAAELGPFSLEDTYDELKEMEKNLREELNQLIKEVTNNKVETFTSTITPEEIDVKKRRYLQALIENINGYDIDIQPTPGTPDMYEKTIADLHQDVKNAEQLLENQAAEMAELKSNIAALEMKKEGLLRMEEACLNQIEEVSNSTYTAEVSFVQKLFSSVKKDLKAVVDKVFPSSPEFQEFLGELTSAYHNGGDEIYINIPPELAICAHFLAEADIGSYHRDDRTKMRLQDLL
ncbi:uncharacterized protein LOC122848629 [Aphidius gifuensis]|nr:uncharacterized protein LOC122848629 [Aphidius gifuensis]